MSNVVGMPGVANALPPNEPDPGIIRVLREWLEFAERGELVGVVIAGTKRSGRTISEWSGAASADQMLAAASGLQYRVVQAWGNVQDDAL